MAGVAPLVCPGKVTWRRIPSGSKNSLKVPCRDKTAPLPPSLESRWRQELSSCPGISVFYCLDPFQHALLNVLRQRSVIKSRGQRFTLGGRPWQTIRSYGSSVDLVPVRRGRPDSVRASRSRHVSVDRADFEGSGGLAAGPGRRARRDLGPHAGSPISRDAWQSGQLRCAGVRR